MGGNTNSKPNQFSSLKKSKIPSSQYKDQLNFALDRRIHATMKTLDENFINFHHKIESAKLNIETKYQTILETIENEFKTRIEDGLNERREALLKLVWNDRDQQLLNYKKYTAGNLMNFKVSPKTNPNYTELYFCNFNKNLDKVDLAHKIKYLNLYDKNKFIHEIGVRVRNVYNINLLYNTDIDATCILILSKQLLFFYSSFTNQIQIKDLNFNVYVSKYLEQILETCNDQVLNEQLRNIEGLNLFHNVKFKSNSKRIVCLKHVYNKSLIVVFDYNLSEKCKLLIEFKTDLCLVSEDYILVKSMRNNEFYLFDLNLDKVNFHVRDSYDSNKLVFTSQDLIVNVTRDKLFVYAQDKGVLRVMCRKTCQQLSLIKILDTSSLKTKVEHIRIDSKSRILIKLSNPSNKMILLNGDGELLCETRFEYLRNILTFDLDANDCLSMLNRSKKSYFFI